MTLSELLTEVYTLTNRPTLVAETTAAVRAATLKIHQKDYFYKDLYEVGIQFTDSEYIQQLDYRTLIPNWRSLKYLRKTDSTGTEQGKFFDIITPDEVLDADKIVRDDVCYVAGIMLQIRSSTQFQYGILGVYRNPDITTLGWNSWIALDHPYAIVFEAAATVFKAIGQTEQFNAYTALAADQLALVRTSNIESVGR